jgi:protein TonB
MVPVPLKSQRVALGLALLASVAVHVGAMDLLAPLGDAARRAMAMLQEPPPLLAVTLVLPAPDAGQPSASPTPPDAPVSVHPRHGGTRGSTRVALVAVPAPSESAVVAPASAAPVSEMAGPATEPESASPDPAAATPATSVNAIGGAAPSSPVAYRSSPPPGYPEASRRDGQQGLTILDVRVAKSGVPVDVAIATTSGFPVLDAAAVAAVTHWRFTPATRDGEAIEARIRIPVRFRLVE